MDKLRQILRTLSEDERKEFTYFIQRQRRKKQRKDLDLLGFLMEEPELSGDDILKALYPGKPNRVAYHALRKRLMHQLTEFILIKRMETDPSTGSTIMGMISMSHYLFSRQLGKLGWSFIRKAEKLAEEHEHYDLLNSIYNVQIEHADQEAADQLPLIIEKRNANKLLADEDERARIANSLINQKLTQVRLEGKDLNFHETIEEVLQEYDLSEAVHRRPRLLYNLVFITRSAALAGKDFYAFEPYIIGLYNRMTELDGFSKRHQGYKLRLLYMIAHVLYRNKKFQDSLSYLDTMEQEIEAFKKSHFTLHYPRFAMLKAGNLVFTGQASLATALLEDLLQNHRAALTAAQQFNLLFSLGFYYFLTKEYNKTVRCVIEMNHSDRWLEKKMGKEWIIRKILGEAILQIQINNPDLAKQRIRTLERQYKGLMARPEYKRVSVYLSFMKHLIQHPDAATRPGFYDEVRNSFNFLPMEQEDLQQVGFYAWLKSQMTGRDFYEVLLELAQRKDEPYSVFPN
ncbi:MAG: hypothetical protein AAFR61_23440 [Bacteroidota bacterium]